MMNADVDVRRGRLEHIQNVFTQGCHNILDKLSAFGLDSEMYAFTFRYIIINTNSQYI